MDIAFVLLGLIGLFGGGHLLVQGAIALASRLGISPLVIGLTVIGFGTSAPELVTSVQAAFAGSPGIAVGNVVGSNIANVLLILGLVSIATPIAVTPATLKRDGGALVAASLFCMAIVLHGFSGRATGALLVLALAVYLVGTWWSERRSTGVAGARPIDESIPIPAAPMSAWRAFSVLTIGLAITVASARLLVIGSVALAEVAGVSETVIGLTVVSIGTSLPEIVTSLIAARRGQADMALGNVVGSNLFNILGILGVTSLLSPLAVPASIVQFDIWVMLAATLMMVAFGATGRRIGRREGATLLTGYAAYLGTLLVVS